MPLLHWRLHCLSVAANHAVYRLLMSNGALNVVYGVVFDAVTSEEWPWFMAYDLDWDISNDRPIDEQIATEVMNDEKALYIDLPYCAYSIYK